MPTCKHPGCTRLADHTFKIGDRESEGDRVVQVCSEHVEHYL